MATATALSTSLPHLPPRRVTSFPSAAVSLPSRASRLRESRLAAAAPTASEVLDSTNGAVPAAAKSAAARGYGREYFPLAAVVGQVRNLCIAVPASFCIGVRLIAWSDYW